jgi:hypothetical protein
MLSRDSENHCFNTIEASAAQARQVQLILTVAMYATANDLRRQSAPVSLSLEEEQEQN